jgi:hypothetical protein
MRTISEQTVGRTDVALGWPSRIPGLTSVLGVILFFTLLHSPVQAGQSVTLAWNPSADTNVTGYFVYGGVASQNYTNKVDAGNGTNATISGLVEGTTYFFAVTAYNILGLESIPSNEASYSVPSAVGNQPPTLNPLGSLAINENAGLQTVNLSGITSGATNEAQTLSVTASSSNPGLIPAPAVTYTSPNATGTLRFTPVANGNGSATITVTVNDGGVSNNIVTQTFTVTVNNTAQAPRVQIRVAPNKQVVLTVTGQVGSTYNIQASPDLTTWTVIGTVVVPAGGSLDFTDTNAASFPKRSYRTQ